MPEAILVCNVASHAGVAYKSVYASVRWVQAGMQWFLATGISTDRGFPMIKTLLALSLAAMIAPAFAAKSCDELKTEIEGKIEFSSR